MKHGVIFLYILLFTSTSVRAQGRIDLFADQAMTQCSLVDNGQLAVVYVVWSGPESAEAVFFSAPRPACWQGATWVGDGFPGPRGSVGNTQTRLLVTLYPPGFGECKKPPVVICAMYFVTNGGAQPCCDLKVVGVPDPLELYPLEYFCQAPPGAYPGPASSGNKVVINPNDTCQCNQPLATESSTWGRVKSLYR